eukprot:526027-Prymnesium_polylepis.1
MEALLNTYSSKGWQEASCIIPPCPHTPGMAGHCLVTLGGHTDTTTTTFGVADTVFDGSNC